MMAIYRKVYNTFWSDPKVADDFTAEDKYFLLYLMTNPHTNLCGCFEISIKQTILETALDKEKIEELINRMETVHHVAEYDNSTREILVLNHHKYNWTKSEDFQKALVKEIAGVKSDKFREYLLERVEETGVSNRRSRDGVETVVGRSMDGGGTTVTVTVPVIDTVTDTVNVKDTVKDTVSDTEKKKTVKHCYGEYNHVKLTDIDFSRLCDEFGEASTLRAIKKVDEYCERSGRSYKNYYLTIRKWGFEDDQKQKPQSDLEKDLDKIANWQPNGGGFFAKI